ncbi:MAG: CehA/McbA family metallohydrolase [Acidobacteriota bacterium]|nr:CehA/McbA family metallohydrolase [Acidobacteriota bacterium]
MRVRKGTGLKVFGALVVIAAIGVIAILPPAALDTGALTPEPGGTIVRGAYHIHSVRSDGSGTVESIAAAASRAGLQFIILTDHGDGTRPPDPPSYRSGVLTIDAVELNTTSGHYAALGLPATPYPFAGTAADVIEDVHRLGGFGIAAHPGSPRPSLAWLAWDAGFDGLEWINADSEWRDEEWWPLARTLLTYPVRAPASIAAVLDRPDGVLSKWDNATQQRRVIALAGADAHARLAFRARTDPDVSSIHVPLPGYEWSFRAFSNHVVLDGPLTGHALIDAPHLLDAIRQGRVFTVIDGLATPGGLDFSISSVQGVARMGEPLTTEGPGTLRARMAAPPGTTLVVIRNGTRLTTTQGDVELSLPPGPAAYRLEAYLPSGPGTPSVPWMVSNPIYVGLGDPSLLSIGDAAPLSRIPARLTEAAPEFGRGDASAVAFSEPRPGTRAGEPPAVWTFALSAGTARGQFAALQIPITGGLAPFDRVRFTVVSDRPMRAWAQLRATVGTPERWGRTFYTDEEERIVDLRLEDFQPIGGNAAAKPPLDKVDSLLFVVDTLNTLPGGTGTITISQVAFVR